MAKRRIFEANTLFDTSHATLRHDGRMLRVRKAGRKGTLTYKGEAVPGKHKDRPEIEVEVSDPGTLARIFDCLNFVAAFRYEKFRTEYARPHESGVATLDETPIGVFLELEGSPAWIDRSARRLGFEESDYSTASYYRLYTDYCRKYDLPVTHMTWDDIRQARQGGRG